MLDEAGEILAEEAMVNTREVLTAFSARYPGARFIMETGTHSPWVSRLLSSLGRRERPQFKQFRKADQRITIGRGGLEASLFGRGMS